MTSVQHATPGAVRERLGWVDAARGYCIVLVVVAHVVLWHLLDASTVADASARSAWGWLYGVLGSVRMPLLLAVSGLVLARRVRAGWRAGGLALRAARNYYLYVVWLAVYAVFYLVVVDPDLPHRVDGPLDLLRQLLVPDTTLWYVLALSVYIVVLGALHRVPPAVVLPVLAVLGVVTHVTTSSEQIWAKVPELAVFFAVGVYGAGPLRRLAQDAGPVRLVLAAVAVLGTTLLGGATDGRPVAAALLFLARGVAFLALAVVVVAVAVRWEPARRLGEELGRRTLPVYVLHPLLIALWLLVARGPAADAVDAALRVPAVALAYPAVLTVAVVGGSLGLHALAVRAGARVPLFAMPQRWEDRISGRPRS